MKAAVLYGARDLRVETIANPAAGSQDIVLQVAACGICGFDLNEYVKPTMLGAGQVPGHEFSGPIVAVGEEVVGLAVGDRVMALPLVRCRRCARCVADEPHLCERRRQVAFGGVPGGFAEQIVVPEAVPGMSVFVLPEGVTYRQGALAEPLGVAVHATSMVRPDDAVVAVFGAGMIGLGMVQMLGLRGVETIVVVEPSARRRQLARRLGADVDLVPGASIDHDLRDAVGGAVDVVIECSSKPTMLAAAMRAVRWGGQVIAASQYPDEALLDPRIIMNGEIIVRGSFASRSRDCATAIRLIAAGKVDTDALLGDAFDLADIDAAFQHQLDVEDAKGVKAHILPSSELAE